MVGGSLWVLRLPPPLKTGCHDIAEILLTVALKNTYDVFVDNYKIPLRKPQTDV
jgi:hypothetical protein